MIYQKKTDPFLFSKGFFELTLPLKGHQYFRVRYCWIWDREFIFSITCSGTSKKHFFMCTHTHIHIYDNSITNNKKVCLFSTYKTRTKTFPNIPKIINPNSISQTFQYDTLSPSFQKGCRCPVSVGTIRGQWKKKNKYFFRRQIRTGVIEASDLLSTSLNWHWFWYRRETGPWLRQL